MNIAVFASGRGSNFQAILNAIHQNVLSAHVCAVVSNNTSAGAIDIARSRGVPAYHISSRQFPSEEAYNNHLIDVLGNHETDFVALAGFMKKLPAAFVRRFRNRIANVHPALLPSFGGPGMFGMNVHKAVIASGAKVSGATVHLVNEEYDRGPIVMQKTVDVSPEDTPETLAAKVLVIEHEIYPRALQAFARGKVFIEGEKAWVRP